MNMRLPKMVVFDSEDESVSTVASWAELTDIMDGLKESV